jgi:hypothetical protein
MRLVFADLWLFEGSGPAGPRRSARDQHDPAAVTLVHGGTKDNFVLETTRVVVNDRVLSEREVKPQEAVGAVLAHGTGLVKVGIGEHRGDLADRRRCQGRVGPRQVVAVVAELPGDHRFDRGLVLRPGLSPCRCQDSWTARTLWAAKGGRESEANLCKRKTSAPHVASTFTAEAVRA